MIKKKIRLDCQAYFFPFSSCQLQNISWIHPSQNFSATTVAFPDKIYEGSVWKQSNQERIVSLIKLIRSKIYFGCCLLCLRTYLKEKEKLKLFLCVLFSEKAINKLSFPGVKLHLNRNRQKSSVGFGVFLICQNCLVGTSCPGLRGRAHPCTMEGIDGGWPTVAGTAQC